jgi:hypothetical protein
MLKCWSTSSDTDGVTGSGFAVVQKAVVQKNVQPFPIAYRVPHPYARYKIEKAKHLATASLS